MMLPLVRRRRLREEESEIWGVWSLERAGLSNDLEESFMEEEERREVLKQMKSSLVLPLLRWGLSDSTIIIFLFQLFYYY